MIRHSRNDYIELSYIYFCAVLTILLLTQINVSELQSRFGIINQDKNNNKKSLTIYNSKSFENIHIKAKAYVVYDILSGKVIASKNIDEVLPLASLTKIMTTVTALGNNKPETLIKISPASLDGGYDLGLKNNQVWKLSELLKYTLVFSSNDGAQEIADSLGGRKKFVTEMNEEAVSLGLSSLHFTEPSGLDLDGEIGGKGNVLEFAKLFALAHSHFPSIFDATTKSRISVKSSTGMVIGIPNTNQGIENIIGAEASKTGYTDSAGGNLAIIVDAAVGHPVVIVVLGSTREERFSDVKTLSNTLQESIRN